MNEIEKWIGDKFAKSSIDVKSLYDESILCYRIKAYRASLLFSYLGFMTFIKELVIKSSKPNDIAQGQWDLTIKELNNEDKWEKKVFELLTNNTKPIFNINDNIRQQIKYWKDRRNDCTHCKDNIIDYSHIDMFWMFLKSNLSKVTVEGGMSSLLEKFKIHFDSTKTPPRKDFSCLINEIESAVEKKEINTFYIELFKIFKSYSVEESIEFEVIEKILTLTTESKFKTELIEHIKNINNLDLKIISTYPTLLREFEYKIEDIREIWTTKIYDIGHPYKHSVISTLLRNNLIPKSELEEAMEKYYSNFDQCGYKNLPNDPITKDPLNNIFLLSIIYRENFEKNKINNSNWRGANSKADLICLYIENSDFDLQIVNSIIELKETNKGNWVTDSIEKLFTTLPTKKNQFNLFCKENNLLNPFLSPPPAPHK